MPKKPDRIADALLLSNGVWNLNHLAPISPRQVEMLTGLSVKMLGERRLAKPPKPPVPFKSDNDEKKGTAIWYPLGEVLAYITKRLARDVPEIEPPPKFTTFTQFLDQAMPHDNWPFTRMLTGELVDFFAALAMGHRVAPDAHDDGWLTLGEYLDHREAWTQHQREHVHARQLAADLHATLESSSDESARAKICPKCGRSSHIGPCRYL